MNIVHAKKCKVSNGQPDHQCDCDSYHTFTELYDHRIALYISLCDELSRRMDVWRSKKHSDGSEWPGWFIMGINEDNGRQITYHIPESEWENTGFCSTFETAPKFDGHTSDDVLERIKTLL